MQIRQGVYQAIAIVDNAPHAACSQYLPLTYPLMSKLAQSAGGTDTGSLIIDIWSRELYPHTRPKTVPVHTHHGTRGAHRWQLAPS